MKTMAFLAACVLATVVIMGPASAQATKPTTQPKVLKFPDVQVDLDARVVTLQTQVVSPKLPQLEMLVCKAGGKEHESILRTKASAAHLHAALLALGLTPGIPGHWIPEAEKYIPPRGGGLAITVAWKDKDGKRQEVDASSWIVTAQDKKAVMPQEWVFIGSDITPDGRYMADMPDMDHIITVSNFGDAVIDVPIRSSDKDSELNFLPNTPVIPPAGTPVEVIIKPVKGADESPYARMLLEINRLGQIRLEGKGILPSQLRQAGEDFVDKHKLAQVVIRADGGAMVFDVERVKLELRLGGVYDFREQPLPPGRRILPRTAQQVTDEMDDWAKRFANPMDYLDEPGASSEAALEQIAEQVKELDARKELLNAYAEQLRKAAVTYKASTQPSGRGKE